MDAHPLSQQLWIGSRPPRGDELAQAGFDALVLCAEEHQPHARHFPGVLVYHRPFRDDPVAVTPDDWRTAFQAATDTLMELLQGGKVLVTCYSGWNRSGLVSALALAEHEGLPKHEAGRRVRAARGPNSLSNPHFARAVGLLPLRDPWSRNPGESDRDRRELERVTHADPGDLEAARRALAQQRRMGPLEVRMDDLESYLRLYPGRTFREIAADTGRRSVDVARVLSCLDKSGRAWSTFYRAYTAEFRPMLRGLNAASAQCRSVWARYPGWRKKAKAAAKWYPPPIPDDYPKPTPSSGGLPGYRNPEGDESLRRLERKASTGSEQDKFSLWLSQMRRGIPVQTNSVYLDFLVNNWTHFDIRYDKDVPGGYTPAPMALANRYERDYIQRAVALLEDSDAKHYDKTMKEWGVYIIPISERFPYIHGVPGSRSHAGELHAGTGYPISFKKAGPSSGRGWLLNMARDELVKRGFSVFYDQDYVFPQLWLRRPVLSLNAMESRVDVWGPYVRWLRFLGGARERLSFEYTGYTGTNPCELCEAAPVTRRYYEDGVVWIADCKSCGVPMVVMRRHTTTPTHKQIKYALQMLFRHVPLKNEDILDILSGGGGAGTLYLDFERSSIPDHWHAHLRVR